MAGIRVVSDQGSARSGQKSSIGVLLLDVSKSMAPDDQKPPLPIHQLNDALAKWLDYARELEASHRQKEFTELLLAVVTFGGAAEVSVVSGRRDASPLAFVPVASLKLDPFRADGNTPLVAAVRLAMSLAEQEKAALRNSGRDFYRPLIWLITDGQPTSPETGLLDLRGLDDLCKDLAKDAAGKHFRFYAIGVEGANEEILKKLAAPSNQYVKLAGLPFKEILEFLTKSVENNAVKAGEVDDDIAALEYLKG